MKLCSDCKYYEEASSASLDRCTKFTFAEPVRGNSVLGFCDSQRLYGKECGPDGNSWEPRDQGYFTTVTVEDQHEQL